MPKVSVITPAYNAAPYLEETVKSVQAQTFTDWEMIIVDDCSKDKTYHIANALAEKDPRIKVFQNEINSGVAVTRNKALDAATGEFIAFLDSDDLWHPKKLETQIKEMEKEVLPFTYTYYQKFDTENGKCGKVIKAPNKMTAKKILGNTAIGCLTVIVNKNIVGQFYMPNIKHTEDNATWHEILSRGYEARLVKEVLAFYREGNQSLTANKTSSIKGQWKTYRDYYGYNIVKSSLYFTSYAIHAVLKHLDIERNRSMGYKNIIEVFSGV